MVGRVGGGPPLRARVVAATGLRGRGDGRARPGARGPARCPVVPAGRPIAVTGRAALGVARVFAVAPAAGILAAACRPCGGCPPGVALPPAIVLVSAPPVAATLAQVRLIVVTAAKPNAQNDGDEDDHDNGHEADKEQDHRTTQLAMAIWVALARRTRPRRGPSPVSLAALDHYLR